jgi:predicted nucleic acid-binding protein
MTPVFLDSSVIVRTVLEHGTSRRVERVIAAATSLVVSRLALVETSRALLRARAERRVSEEAALRAETEVDDLLARCEIWELSRLVCDEARRLAPTLALRTLDALHLATFTVARKRLPTLRLLSTDERMLAAAAALGLRLAKA